MSKADKMFVKLEEEFMSKKVEVSFVSGSDGYSLQITNKTGGYRFAGPKAWGNPRNKPTASFEVDVEDLIECLREYSYGENS